LFGWCIHRRAFIFSFGRRISLLRRILFVRPAHPIIVPQSLRLPAHSPRIHQFGVVPFGRRIPCRAATDLALFHLDGAFPADLVSSFAGAFAANPVSLFLAGASPRRATITLFGRRIPSPCHDAAGGVDTRDERPGSALDGLPHRRCAFPPTLSS